jgi:hypothetical protein
MDLAVALVRDLTMGRLRRAVMLGTLADVLDARTLVLRCRLGQWTASDGRDAIYLIERAVLAAVETADFQNNDDAEIDEDDIVARIRASEVQP